MIRLDHEVLQNVLKPSRYTGGEWNAVKKDWDNVDCTFALSLPDVYEVGMSNLGLAILYDALNRQENVAAERVYAPWTDMEKEMRQRNIPLFSLETHTELSAFDLWGFSLQYEMIYSNVLNMLDLAGIPLFAKDRDDTMPFIVGGGPCVYNVEPIADFFDFFIVGEAEEAVVEIAQAIAGWKKAGRQGGRRGFLKRLLTMDGIYVPSFYEPQYDGAGNYLSLKALDEKAKPLIFKRVCRDMDEIPSVENPIVPFMDIVHNRIMLELFRGCSRGCRFCQAGICYRPARERTEKNLKAMARQLVDKSGYDEMSLTSLSSADYSCLGNLVNDLMEDFKNEKVSFSLPSLRIDSFSIELAHKMQQVRKSGLTFAPEAGTQRLRDVINKGVTEENLMNACGSAFRQGWKQVKLYFMMGLPTETDEDIIGIAKLAKKVVDLYTEIKGRRGVKVTISVACFVPKPYTPFQWFGQLPIAEFERRQQLLKENITDRAITFNYHDARLSVIEGVFARGDRRLGKVLYQAWQDGAKFDGWSDLYQHDTWLQAFEKCGVDMNYYNERSRDFNEPLPWDITSPGVNKEFLLREWKKAMEGALTEDCRRGKCSACGICPNLGVHVIDYAKENPTVAEQIAKVSAPKNPETDPKGPGKPRTLYKYRAEITKGEELRYVSHLDYANLFLRAFDRAKLPMAYSEGFNPHMKVAFASALSLGVTSDAEYMDFELLKPLCQPEVFDRLNAQLPPGAKLKELREVHGKQPALMAQADEARYTLLVPYDGDEAAAQRAVKAYNDAVEVIFHRVTPKKKREIETKQYMKQPVTAEVTKDGLKLVMDIVITQSGSVKPVEVLRAITEQFALPVDAGQALITRNGLFGHGKRLIELV
ncbi:MAG: TIGR03960 family B12-binding radical SAM protein [Selenomonas sp.]|uniref:TIGR03960 family B12-binding radical SAM protein n=1 Tax=Selenomonas sp. TaxID=2053611 RepID=UPI0025DD8939|nr:TIGR03960 family B12-binding radical SAM protein [Selenomonas sp.]MCR5439985.1 TIGR03960 family B12-binding radical SAM protein [Selenomonas sp.]